MKKYRLVYLQPFEYDDDSSEGIGDHSIEWSQVVHEFEAESDYHAQLVIETFLQESSVVFSVNKLTYKRHPISLTEARPISEWLEMKRC